jgi:uncharacterized protein (DUF1684 family)
VLAAALTVLAAALTVLAAALTALAAALTVRRLRRWNKVDLMPRLVRSIGALVMGAMCASCANRPPEEPKDYAAKIAAERAAKDAAFLRDNDPIPVNRKGELLPLGYFPIDPDYNVPAALKPIDDPSIVEMTTSAGGADKFRRVGTLEFSLKGQPLKLTAFTPAASKNADRLFVPFSDLTSGTETYAAGRFLDIDRTATGIYEIDFNRAYFPYCYYSPTWECPYPPAENRLKVPIRAGERMKKSQVSQLGSPGPSQS